MSTNQQPTTNNQQQQQKKTKAPENISSLMLSFFSPVKFQTLIRFHTHFSRFFEGKNSPAPVGGLQGKGLQAEALAGHGDHLQGRQLRLFRLRFV